MNEFYYLLQAAETTLGLAFLSLLLGLLFAMVFAFCESARYKCIAWPSTLLVMLIRGLPEILVILAIYYGLSQLLLTLADGFTLDLFFFQLPVKIAINNFDISPFICGVMALGLLFGAYASQTLRGAFKALPRGQSEAGLALGMPPTQIFFRIILPQIWQHALPGLGNQWLVLLKDTALVSLISVNDLMLQTKGIATRTQQPFTWYLIAAAIYLIITLISQRLLARLTRQVTRFVQEPQ